MKPIPPTKPVLPAAVHNTRESHGTKAEAAPAVERQIRDVVLRWSGTPHKMGGNDKTGIDCSGFVQKIFSELFNIRLPRTTLLQVQIGTPVDSTELSSGDLVFFRPPDKIRHVGIYLSSGEFAHASASHGVTISSLRTPYWRDAYWTSRRILPDRMKNPSNHPKETYVFERSNTSSGFVQNPIDICVTPLAH